MGKIITAIIVILLIIGAYLLWRDDNPGAEVNGNNNATTTNNGGNSTSTPEQTATERNVAYTATGFSPRTITINRGDTVVFTNQGGGEMWVASAIHPTHEVYSGTTLSQHCPDTDNDSFDQCAVGGTYRFTFTKAGTWNYHNHRNASNTGTVIVQ